ncbi:MAG: hypothetical protein U0271_42490 [Polyangiaceae bacterium]
MASGRSVFDGCIEIATGELMDDDEQTASIDEPFTKLTELRFTLDYPFESPLACEVRNPKGISVRDVVAAVQVGFRRMYAGATEEPISGLVNVRVNGDFGEALHAITDLVIEGISVDEDEATLTIDIGS